MQIINANSPDCLHCFGGQIQLEFQDVRIKISAVITVQGAKSQEAFLTRQSRKWLQCFITISPVLCWKSVGERAITKHGCCVCSSDRRQHRKHTLMHPRVNTTQVRSMQTALLNQHLSWQLSQICVRILCYSERCDKRGPACKTEKPGQRAMIQGTVQNVIQLCAVLHHRLRPKVCLLCATSGRWITRKVIRHVCFSSHSHCIISRRSQIYHNLRHQFHPET